MVKLIYECYIYRTFHIVSDVWLWLHCMYIRTPDVLLNYKCVWLFVLYLLLKICNKVKNYDQLLFPFFFYE